MARIANADWLISENKEVLQRYNNPHINYVDITPTRQDQRQDYMNFGINIVRLIETRAPRNLMPEESWGDFTNILMLNEDAIHNFRVKIPHSRTSYVYTGKVKRYSVPEYLIVPDSIVTIEFNELYRTDLDNATNLSPRFPLAYVAGNTIFPCFDLTERTPANKAIMRFLLDKALSLIPEATYRRSKPENYEEHEFTEAMKQFLGGRQRNIKQELIEHEQNAERGFREYVQSTRRVADLRIAIASSEASDKTIEENCREAIEYFKKHKNVASWKAVRSQLILVLKELKITYKKETIDIPQMEVSINLEHGDFRAITKDKDHPILRCHPHIFDHGGACVGNFTTIFPKIVASGKLAQVLELLIQFFETYNESSPAIGWSKWRYMLKHNINAPSLNEDQRVQAEREWADYLERLAQ